jgi:ataxia telangiectasia mutated family protein
MCTHVWSWQVPVITAHIPVDPGCQYQKGSLPYYKGLSDTVQYVPPLLSLSLYFNLGFNSAFIQWVSRSEEMFGFVAFWLVNDYVSHRIMNGINAPKVVECKGSDGRRYKQLAKSGNDDLRQDAVRFVGGSLLCSLLHWVAGASG